MKSKAAQPAHRGSGTQVPTSLLSPKLSQPTAHLPGMEAFGLDSTQKCGVLMLDPRVECVDRSPSKKQNSERELGFREQRHGEECCGLAVR